MNKNAGSPDTEAAATQKHEFTTDGLKIEVRNNLMQPKIVIIYIVIFHKTYKLEHGNN